MNTLMFIAAKTLKEVPEMNNQPEINAIRGALIGDAAALGLHWIYDQARIAEVAGGRAPVFRQPEQANYKGVPGYFAHGLKKAGDLSGCGETLRLCLRSVLSNGGNWDRLAFQQAFVDFYGPQGAYHGYLDTPTKGVLERLRPLKSSDYPAISGVDDDQTPAFCTIPVMAALYHGRSEFQNVVENAVRITHDNVKAVKAGQGLAAALKTLFDGEEMKTALQRFMELLTADQRGAAQEILAMPTLDLGEATQRSGMDCHLDRSVPLSLGILGHCQSFRQAIELNILAGGDSCGRAMIVGALAGAAFLAQENDLLNNWFTRISDHRLLAEELEQLAGYLIE
jgi:ADP-ribosylglycohydrolase